MIVFMIMYFVVLVMMCALIEQVTTQTGATTACWSFQQVYRGKGMIFCMLDFELHTVHLDGFLVEAIARA